MYRTPDQAREDPLDGVVAADDQESHKSHDPDDSDQIGEPERLLQDRPGGGRDHRHDDHHESDVEDFEGDPESPQKMLKEAPVLEGAKDARKLVAHDADRTPHHGGQRHCQKTPEGATRQEELGQLAAGPVPSGNHYRLEYEPGQQVTAQSVHVRSLLAMCVDPGVNLGLPPPFRHTLRRDHDFCAGQPPVHEKGECCGGHGAGENHHRV